MHRVQPQTTSPLPQLGPCKPNRRFTDGSFLLVMIIWLCLSIFIGLSSWIHSDHYRLIYGVDSWGNTCNRDNKHIENVTLSGLSMVGKTHVFYFHPDTVAGPHRSKEVILCVPKCPDEMLLTLRDLALYAAKTGTRLCRYDVAPADYVSRGANKDICPPLPVLPQSQVRMEDSHRCGWKTVTSADGRWSQVRMEDSHRCGWKTVTGADGRRSQVRMEGGHRCGWKTVTGADGRQSQVRMEDSHKCGWKVVTGADGRQSQVRMEDSHRCGWKTVTGADGRQSQVRMEDGHRGGWKTVIGADGKWSQGRMEDSHRCGWKTVTDADGRQS
ncbi:hypothetical protein LSAT2_029077 [Lamellibrachia satsuma]|nr:hypothetical protein LSAT2_029077 [Lamellibrachia satsuma]